MYISLTTSRTNGFRKRSDTHRPDSDDDDNSGGSTPIVITEPPCDDSEAIQEPPNSPWLVPGTGSLF